MTKTTTTTNRYRIPADRIQNLEIDRNGGLAPRLHDLEPLENTLLSVLYPGIKVASVNVPAELTALDQEVVDVHAGPHG